MPTWDPKQYLAFDRERTRPCLDLLARVEVDPVDDAVDLGCGPGNSTMALARRFPGARILGLDNSPAMIERARRVCPVLAFEVANAVDWTPTRLCDVILSNAVFQWVGDHDTLFPRLVAQLRSGGALAVQMPRNFEAPTHRILRELAHTEPWASKLSAREPYWVKPPGFYYDVLTPVTSSLDLWETEYQHVLPDHHAIIEWYKGTGLRPYLEALSAAEQPAFLEALETRLVEAYPRQADGRVLFPFLRLFFVAVR